MGKELVSYRVPFFCLAGLLACFRASPGVPAIVLGKLGNGNAGYGSCLLGYGGHCILLRFLFLCPRARALLSHPSVSESFATY